MTQATPQAPVVYTPGTIIPTQEPQLGPNGLRVVTPTSYTYFQTCPKEGCQPGKQLFVQQTPCNSSPCQVTTQFVPRPTEKPVFTCPEFEFRSTPITNKLDILIVVDTSDSMHEERMLISAQMTNFIAQLSPDVEYRIGVLLGHGPHSTAPGVRLGELYVSPHVPGDMAVIKQDEILARIKSQGQVERDFRTRNPGASAEDVRKAISRAAAEQITKMLINKMQNGSAGKLPIDKSPAQGEAGLLNLYTALKEGRQRDQLKSQGLLNNDAALQVLFVADENDVCYDYHYESKRLGQTIEPRKPDLKRFPGMWENTELKAFLDPQTCAQAANGQRLTPQIVFDTTIAAKSGMPVVFSGILYIDNSQIPVKSDIWASENEMGHGYLDVIELGVGKAGNLSKNVNGIKADLSKEDFGHVLAKLGDFANFRMKYEHVVELKNLHDANDIDPATIAVYMVENGNKKLINEYNSSFVTFIPGADRTSGRLVIQYESIQAVKERDLMRKGTSVVIQYSTFSGKGPADGIAPATAQPTTVTSALPAPVAAVTATPTIPEASVTPTAMPPKKGLPTLGTPAAPPATPPAAAPAPPAPVAPKKKEPATSIHTEQQGA